MNVLITSASRKVGLVRAFQSAMARRGRGFVIAVDASPFSPALYAADKRFLVPLTTDPIFTEEFLRLCLRQKVGLVIPTRDEELAVFATVADRFKDSGVKIMVPGADTLAVCQDKAAFVNFCEEHKFETPRTYRIDELSDSSYPLFLKPRSGKGGRRVHRVLNHAALLQVEAIEDFVIQECVEDPEYTVDLLADFEGRVLAAVPRLRQSIVAGESYISRTINESHIIEEATRLATELRLFGQNTIQCFWNGARLRFIEVNPRFGGGSVLAIAAGIDAPDILLRLMDGKMLEQPKKVFQHGLTMLRFTDDFFLPADSLLAPDTPAEEARPVQAVLFDLDNTLYPEEQFLRSGFWAVARRLSPITGSAPESLVERMFELLHREGRGHIFDLLLRELELDSEIWLRTLLFVYRSHQPAISLFPGTEGHLVSLRNRGWKLGLITDGAASTQRQKISALGLERYMDVIVCTEELGSGFGKPSTTPFEVALKLLGVTPENAMYVADDVGKDFAGPNRLGMKSVRVQTNGLVGMPKQPHPTDTLFHPQIEMESLSDAFQSIERL